MVVVTMRGRWTIKRRKEKKKRKRRRKGPLRKRLDGRWLSLYIPTGIFRDGRKSTNWWWLGSGLVGRTGSQTLLLPVQFINPPMPRGCETSKGHGPNSNLRQLRS